MANVWVQQLGLFVDDVTGNTFDPQEGFWRSPDRTLVFGGQFGENWQASPGGLGVSQASSNVSGYNALSLAQGIQRQAQQAAGGGQPQVASSQVASNSTAGATNPNAFKPLAGSQSIENELDRSQETLIRNLMSANSEKVAQIQADVALKVSQGEITQSEGEFVRKYALDQQSQKFAEELGRAQLEISKRQTAVQEKDQALQERQVGAQLAANPSDWIAYQYYTRQPGYTQQQGLPPGYSDQQIQDVAQGLFNPGSNQYNPGLQGTGAFGAQIQAPNTFSRSEMVNLSPTQHDMISGLLKAGINTGGSTVPVVPDDYFGQVSRSLIPTLAEGSGKVTQYA